MHYLYRQYHSSSTNTQAIKSDAGLSRDVPFRLLCSSKSSCSKSNRRMAHIHPSDFTVRTSIELAGSARVYTPLGGFVPPTTTALIF